MSDPRINVDELTKDELIHTELELLSLIDKLKISSRDQSRLKILAKRKFRHMQDVLRFRDSVKRGVKNGKF
jgi:hypothetical protein